LAYCAVVGHFLQLFRRHQVAGLDDLPTLTWTRRGRRHFGWDAAHSAATRN
jgi:hypothetical protein